MSEKEKNLMTRFSDVIPKLDKEDQSYILGVAEGMAILSESKNNNVKTHNDELVS